MRRLPVFVESESRPELPAFDEFHKTVIAQEAEVAHKIKVGRTHFHFCQVDDLLQIPLPVTPVESGDGDAGPGARRISIALVGRNLVERDGPKSFPLNDDPGSNSSLRVRSGDGLDGTLESPAGAPFQLQRRERARPGDFQTQRVLLTEEQGILATPAFQPAQPAAERS